MGASWSGFYTGLYFHLVVPWIVTLFFPCVIMFVSHHYISNNGLESDALIGVMHWFQIKLSNDHWSNVDMGIYMRNLHLNACFQNGKAAGALLLPYLKGLSNASRRKLMQELDPLTTSHLCVYFFSFCLKYRCKS